MIRCQCRRDAKSKVTMMGTASLTRLMLILRLRAALKLATAAMALLFGPGRAIAAPAQPMTSVYTDLAADRCQTLEIEEKEGAFSRQRCPGVAGYRLLVLDDDSRMTVTVEDPAGKAHPLELWTLVSTGFSSLGPRAEWRMARRSGSEVPVALIVRFNASDPESKVTSYLVVARIAADGICVVAAVPPGPEANEKAREVADGASERPCLREPLGE
jgi:hypothetical protein